MGAGYACINSRLVFFVNRFPSEGCDHSDEMGLRIDFRLRNMAIQVKWV